MYIPRRFEEKDREAIFSFMREFSFALLVTANNDVPVATHIPLALELNAAGEGVLVGHISKGNHQKTTIFNGSKALCIFQGPHAYISPGWYTQMNVPTWNYISVHAYGTIRLMEGDELRAALSRLMNKYEQHMAEPRKLEDIPAKSLEDDIRGIIGFQITIEELQAAKKLSQNRDEESYHNIIHHLQQGNESANQVASAMMENTSDLFKKG